MPNYTYHCQDCQTYRKITLPFGSKEEVLCSVCQSKTQRLITPPAMIFKGSGFYKTDSTKTPQTKQTEEKNTTEKTGKESPSDKAPNNEQTPKQEANTTEQKTTKTNTDQTPLHA